MNFSLIKSKGKPLVEIAKEAGITYRQLHRYETKESEATESVIIRLCDALGCTADELLGRDKKTPSDESEGAETKGKEIDGTDKNTL